MFVTSRRKNYNEPAWLGHNAAAYPFKGLSLFGSVGKEIMISYRQTKVL